MNYKGICFLLVFSMASIASAADTRTFPDFECSFTLPGKDWQWLNPELVKTAGKALVFARSQKKLAIVLAAVQLKPTEVPNSRSFESFESGMLTSGSLKKLNSTKLTFKNVPSYQVDANLPSGQGTKSRILYANGRLYLLQIINGVGSLDGNNETEPVFQGFNFLGQPKPPFAPDDDTSEAYRLGQKFGQGLIPVVAIVVVCVYLLKRIRSSRVTGQS